VVMGLSSCTPDTLIVRPRLARPFAWPLPGSQAPQVDRYSPLVQLERRLQERHILFDPALLTMMSRRPTFWAISRIRPLTSSGSETSAPISLFG